MIWGKKPKTQSEEATIVSIVPSEPEVSETIHAKAAPSVIAAQTNVLGSVVCAGDLSVDGNVEGDVRCALFTVGAGGHIAGNVTAETATVRGKISGNVVARTILLAGTGSIEGDLTHAVLIIEEGGVFEGRSKRLADPLGAHTNQLEAPAKKSSDTSSTIIDKTKPSAKRAANNKNAAGKAKEKTVSPLAAELEEGFALNT